LKAPLQHCSKPSVAKCESAPIKVGADQVTLMNHYLPTNIDVSRIRETGLGFRFQGVRYFCIADEDDVYVYVNQCPHFGVALEWMPDAFLDSKRQNIQCSQHSALFDIQSGFCHRGPCEGDSLTKVASKVVNGALWLAPD